jgi:hypothetical protein
MFLDNHHIYFRGYRSTSIIFILICLTGIILNLFYPSVKNLVAIIIISIQAIALTICCIFAFFLTWEVVADYDDQLYYNDSKYRLEETSRGIMRSCGLPSLFVKNGIFEKKYELNKTDGWGICFVKKEVKSVVITELTHDSVSVIIYHTKEDSTISNPLVRTIWIK